MMENTMLSVSERMEQLLRSHPELTVCKESILDAFALMRDAFRNGKKLLVAGNGGSAADSSHIVGELMKSFQFRRRSRATLTARLEELFGEQGRETATLLEEALPAVALPEMMSLSTAYMNDVSPVGVFAQGVCGLGKKDDVFLAISTSGNSPNILYACMTARALDMKVVGLTGKTGGKMVGLCDSLICAPYTNTFEIQECHLPIYHALCAMLEAEFFGREKLL